MLNAGNIQVGGTSTGVPVITAPNISALTAASSAAGSAAKTDTPTGNTATDRPSIILVEFLGFGGGDGTPQPQQEDRRKKEEGRSQIDGNSYDPYSPVHLLGNGKLAEKQKKKLSVDEMNNLEKLVGQSGAF